MMHVVNKVMSCQVSSGQVMSDHVTLEAVSFRGIMLETLFSSLSVGF